MNVIHRDVRLNELLQHISARQLMYFACIFPIISLTFYRQHLQYVTTTKAMTYNAT